MPFQPPSYDALVPPHVVRKYARKSEPQYLNVFVWAVILDGMSAESAAEESHTPVSPDAPSYVVAADVILAPHAGITPVRDVQP